MCLIHRAAAVGMAVMFALSPCAAQAELGGTASSVAADQRQMSARRSSFSRAGYTLHELTRPNGGAVHEFANAGGMVFAVTWSGPGKPDLRSLLGRYFSAFQANSLATARRMHGLRQPPRTAPADLQIQVGGHMGWFHGVAFVPSLAPPGFSVGDLAEQQ